MNPHLERVIQGYGTMQQILNNRQRGNQLIQRSMQVTPGLIGIGSQLGGALSQLVNAYAGSRMVNRSNAQENALINAMAQAALQKMGAEPDQEAQYPQQPSSMTPQQAQGATKDQIAQVEDLIRQPAPTIQQ